MVVGGAAAAVQHLVIRGLEQAVPDVVPAEHSPVQPRSLHPHCGPPVHAVGEVLEHDLSVGVAASLPGGEPGLGGLGGGVEGGRHRDLGLEPGADVDLVDLHQRLVQVVLHRHLEPLAGLQLNREVVFITINTLTHYDLSLITACSPNISFFY